ncbi:MAG TPA: AAA family ATPase [Patescibacteria group bacterium]|nr:AAA family ATPase [Patescibacteria group bacterium]
MIPAAVKARARKARIRQGLAAQPLRLLLGISALALAGLAACAFVLHRPLFLLGLVAATPIFILLQWYQGELHKLESVQDIARATAFQAVLEAELLSKLPANPSLQQVIEATDRTHGGNFFASRFQIPLNIFKEQASNEPGSAASTWQQAQHLAVQNQRTQIDASNVAVAIILGSPMCDTVLPHMGLTREDIMAGCGWYAHLQDTLERFNGKQSFGGIGRDLAFGYTPLLSQLGYNITQTVQRSGLMRRQLEGHDRVLGNMVQVLANAGRQNIALVGEVGSGRTTVVYALAEQLLTDKGIPQNLRYRQVVGLDASAILSHVKGRGELEQTVVQVMHEAVKAKNIILFLDDAHLFLQDGNGSVDLSNILLPVLEGGVVRMILTFSESWWQKISQTNPTMAQLLNRVSMPPLDKESTLRAAEDQVPLMEHRYNVIYTYQALLNAYDLANRFVQDQAFPGRAITVLEAAANFAQQGLVTVHSVEEAIEQRFGVKVHKATDSSERDVLLHLEDEIHKTMINQTRAVKVVSDALRRARAGVRNTKRPMGTFLFLGPTGVGKTELSKSLATAYFGGADHLVRVDLNEHSEATDVGRMLESAATNPNSLCAQIAKQPFSVVLLDEIEKAHPNVLNLLLQMLDEGILRDVNNREVNFREAIIIATSNAGADRIREHIQKGEQLEQFEQEFVDELINNHDFKPEFLNRFDEIVLFRPLTPEELLQVVDIIIAQTNQTLASQKVSIQVTDEAKRWLVQQGYDPRLGARPLRRVVQRTVENVVAKRLLTGEAGNGSAITLDVNDLTAQ